MTTPYVIVVAGPTASGKSDFAVELAQKVNGEVISCDSRQVYKDLDIGTGKIMPEEMKGVPHHMLSVYELKDEVSVARFARDALPLLNEILNRGKTPILVGGTGQYIDALIFEGELPPVPPNPELREHLETLSTEELAQELLLKEPARAQAIDIHNRPRLIRALEIVEALGKVPPLATPQLKHQTKIYLLQFSKEDLRKRIKLRLEKRLKHGMIEEVKNVMLQGFTSTDMKKFGLEYEVIALFLEGKISENEMKDEIVRKSMQYAKRQITWNKKYEKMLETEIIKK